MKTFYRCWKTTVPILAWTFGRVAKMSVRSVSQSAQGRSFQSPFSHLDLFGRELPGCTPISSGKASEKLLACTSDSVIEKRKSKGSRNKKTSLSSKASHSSTSSSTASKKKGKKKRSKVSSDSAVKVSGSKSSVSSRSTMAPVDSDRILQSLPIRQPTVSKNPLDGSRPLRTQTVENEKTKTRYSRCLSEPPVNNKSSPLAEYIASPTRAQSNPKIRDGIEVTHQRELAKLGKDTEGPGIYSKMSMSKHLSHSSLSTSAYLRKFITTHGAPSAGASHHTPTSGTPSSSHLSSSPIPTHTKPHSSFSLPSPSHNPVNTSKVNVRLRSMVPHYNFGARTFKTGSERSPEGGNELGHVEELLRGLKHMQYHQVIVMSGAGISTASGIPDFRCGTGQHS